MTLQEFFQLLSAHPSYVLAFFLLLPLLAVLTGVLSRGHGHESPWKYWYSGLIYLAIVPGVFAVTLSIYLFLFERRSIMQTDIYTQVLPVLSMVVTLLIIRRQVDLRLIPGFDKLGGLIMMVAAALAFMWFLDRTRIWMVTFLPFQYVVLVFVVLLIILRFGWKRMLGGR